jgi:hypothetical protein
MDRNKMAAEITAASRVLRESAARALPALRWCAESGVVTVGDDTVATAPDDDPEQAEIDASYMALVDPAVGEALAGLLARLAHSESPDDVQAALAVARALTRREES